MDDGKPSPFGEDRNPKRLCFRDGAPAEGGPSAEEDEEEEDVWYCMDFEDLCTRALRAGENETEFRQSLRSTKSGKLHRQTSLGDILHLAFDVRLKNQSQQENPDREHLAHTLKVTKQMSEQLKHHPADDAESIPDDAMRVLQYWGCFVRKEWAHTGATMEELLQQHEHEEDYLSKLAHSLWVAQKKNTDRIVHHIVYFRAMCHFIQAFLDLFLRVYFKGRAREFLSAKSPEWCYGDAKDAQRTSPGPPVHIAGLDGVPEMWQFGELMAYSKDSIGEMFSDAIQCVEEGRSPDLLQKSILRHYLLSGGGHPVVLFFLLQQFRSLLHIFLAVAEDPKTHCGMREDTVQVLCQLLDMLPELPPIRGCNQPCYHPSAPGDVFTPYTFMNGKRHFNHLLCSTAEVDKQLVQKVKDMEDILLHQHCKDFGIHSRLPCQHNTGVSLDAAEEERKRRWAAACFRRCYGFRWPTSFFYLFNAGLLRYFLELLFEEEYERTETDPVMDAVNNMFGDALSKVLQLQCTETTCCTEMTQLPVKQKIRETYARVIAYLKTGGWQCNLCQQPLRCTNRESQDIARGVFAAAKALLPMANDIILSYGGGVCPETPDRPKTPSRPSVVSDEVAVYIVNYDRPLKFSALADSLIRLTADRGAAAALPPSAIDPIVRGFVLSLMQPPKAEGYIE